MGLVVGERGVVAGSGAAAVGGGGVGHRRHRLDRARAAHGHLEAEPLDLARQRRQHGVDEAAAGVDRAGVHAVGAEEAPGQADGAQLEAADGQDVAALAHQHLGAAAADVDHQEATVEDGHRLQDAEVDEAGLLDPGDDLDLDAGLVAGPARGSPRRSRPRAPRWWRRPRRGASEMSATRRNRVSASMPRSMASGASSFMSPPPEPSRTVSFSSAMTSKWPTSSKRATTRWIELVPMSMAARFSPIAARA